MANANEIYFSYSAHLLLSAHLRARHSSMEQRYPGLKTRRCLQEAYIVVKETDKQALAGVAQWVVRHPANQKVTGLNPSQGTCLGCSQFQIVGVREAADPCISCTTMFLSFPF